MHDLHAALGELAQVGAWIAYDAEHQALARQLTTEALLHSRLAGDRHQELFELAQLAMQSIHVGRPTEALQIADQVIEDEDPVTPGGRRLPPPPGPSPGPDGGPHESARRARPRCLGATRRRIVEARSRLDVVG